MQRARVHRVCADDSYDLSLWQTYWYSGKQYQEGFSTPEPIFVVRPRSELYVKQKQEQELSALVQAGAQSSSRATKSAVFLLMLYADAERTLPFLRELGDSVLQKLPKSSVAPPKSFCESTREVRLRLPQADGSGAHDVRGPHPSATRDVLNALATSDGFQVILVKNCLSSTPVKREAIVTCSSTCDASPPPHI
jgi:hypothetical protein